MNTDPPQDQLNALANLYHSGKMIRAIHTCKELLKTYKQSLVLFNILGAALQATGLKILPLHQHAGSIPPPGHHLSFYN